MATSKTAERTGQRRRSTSDGGETTKRRQLVDAEIYSVATKLFATKGYSGTSLQDIADALGMSRPSLYHYVSSKEDMLAKLVSEFTESKAFEHGRVVSDASLEPAAKLHHMVTSTVRSMAEHPERFRMLDRYENELPDRVMEKQRAAKRAVRDAFTTVIREGVRTGQFQPVDPEITAFGLIGMCTWVAWWFSPSRGGDVDRIVAMLGALAVRSVLQEGASGSPSGDAAAVLDSIRSRLDLLQDMIPSSKD